MTAWASHGPVSWRGCANAGSPLPTGPDFKVYQNRGVFLAKWKKRGWGWLSESGRWSSVRKVHGVVGCGVRVGGNGGNPKKAESHLRRSESTQGAPGVQGGLFGVQEGAVGSQEVAGKWRCMNDFSQKVEDFSRFFEIGSFRPWRRRRWSRLAERSPKPVSPTKTDKGQWVSDDTRKIRRFSRRTCRPGYWPVTHPGFDGFLREIHH